MLRGIYTCSLVGDSCLVHGSREPSCETERNKSTRSTVSRCVDLRFVSPFLQLPSIAAFSTLLLTTGLIGGLLINPSTSSKGQELLSWLYDRWLGLLTAAFVNSVLQAIAVYWQSFYCGELLAKGGNSGNFVYDVSCLLLALDIYLSSDRYAYRPTLCGSFGWVDL
jgi:hypothetical protein